MGCERGALRILSPATMACVRRTKEFGPQWLGTCAPITGSRTGFRPWVGGSTGMIGAPRPIATDVPVDGRLQLGSVPPKRPPLAARATAPSVCCSMVLPYAPRAATGVVGYTPWLTYRLRPCQWLKGLVRGAPAAQPSFLRTFILGDDA
jgi:hypothetical protein